MEIGLGFTQFEKENEKGLKQFWKVEEILYLVYFRDCFNKDWTKATEEFKTILDENFSVETVKNLFAQVSKQGNLKYYRRIIARENYATKIRLMKVNKIDFWFKLVF